MNYFETSILYLIFKSHEMVERTWHGQPKRLFAAVEAPEGYQNKEDLCDASRQYILSKIDCKYEVITLFRKANLDCGKAVSEAISRFFGHLGENIISEDDILASQDLFKLSKPMLEC